MRNAYHALTLALVLLTPAAYAGGGGATGGATEVTQLLNNGQLIEQVRQQMETVRNQITDLQKLNPADLLLGANKSKILQNFQDLSRLYREGQNIARAGEDVYKYYKDMGNINLSDAIRNGNYPQLFYKWSSQNHDTVKGILEQNRMNMEWFNDQQKELATYNQLLNSSSGTVSALQAAGKIANSQVDSLGRLAQIQMSQNNLIASQAATAQSEKDMDRARLIQQKQVEISPEKGKTTEEIRKQFFN